MQLIRVASTRDGVFGVLLDGGFPFAVTCEPEDKGNQRNISCIPPGIYECKRTKYNKGGYEVFEVTDVPDRSSILIHRGNTEDNSAGCILVAEQFETLDGKTAVLRSRKGFDEFMKRLEGQDSFTLQIINANIEEGGM